MTKTLLADFVTCTALLRQALRLIRECMQDFSKNLSIHAAGYGSLTATTFPHGHWCRDKALDVIVNRCIVSYAYWLDDNLGDYFHT